MNKTVTDWPPATRDELMRHLAAGITEHNLPSPAQIHTRTHYAGVVVDELTAAHTWIAWLGCGPLASETFKLAESRTYERMWAEVAWRGWTIRVLMTRTAVAS